MVLNALGEYNRMSDLNTKFYDKLIVYFGKQETQKKIKEIVLDPLLNHVMKRVFPYIILTCVLFVLLLFAVLITLGVVVFNIRAPGKLAVDLPSLPI
jgi:hypothetical protein